MSELRDQKIVELSKKLAAEFLSRESNRQSLITVTRAEISPDGKRITILVSVLPENKADTALDFIKRNRGEFRSYVLEKSRIGRVPTYDFALDVGEKNRQRIDELSYGIEKTDNGQDEAKPIE